MGLRRSRSARPSSRSSCTSLVYGSDVITDFGVLISFVFDVALVLLLVHPMSRDYQRIWFK